MLSDSSPGTPTKISSPAGEASKSSVLTNSEAAESPVTLSGALSSGRSAGAASVVVVNTPENRGMIDKVAYLVRVEEA